MMAAPMFILNKWFRFLLGMRRSHAIEHAEITYCHRNCDSLHFDRKASLGKKDEVLSFLIRFYFTNLWKLKPPVLLIIMARLL